MADKSVPFRPPYPQWHGTPPCGIALVSQATIRANNSDDRRSCVTFQASGRDASTPGASDSSGRIVRTRAAASWSSSLGGCVSSPTQCGRPDSSSSIGRGDSDSIGLRQEGCAGSESGPGPGLLVEDTTADNWRMPLRRQGSVVALGKFDALHRGHRALAVAAAALARELAAQPAGTGASSNGAGDSGISGATNVCSASSRAIGGSGEDGDQPNSWHDAAPLPSRGCAAGGSGGDAVLLSFRGMAEVLGWPDRLPLTAPQDRGRVLASWVAVCGGATGAATARPPRLRTLPFSLIRSMSPEEFVALLARDLGAAGVVAGRNYRFGYKAAGDADTLLRLGQQYGMRVQIVDLVMLPDHDEGGGDVGVTRSTDTSTPADAASDSGSNSNNGSPGDCLMPVATGGVRPAYRSDASTDLDVELPTRAARALCSGGGGEADSSCSRVSSSRIRELLASGRVEAVESLLGRKYRLVCRLGSGACGAAAAAPVSCSDAGAAPTRRATEVEGVVADSVGGPSRPTTAGAEGMGGLFVRCDMYQNQPPANGQYRALVRLASSSGVSVDDADAESAVAGAPFARATTQEQTRGAETTRSSGDTSGDDRGGSVVFGPACVTVALSDVGIRVESPSLSRVVTELAAASSKVTYLLIDFDACD